MLVLSRQKDETIMIGDDVEITVVDIRGDKVRLGIKAPPHIPVHRKEVYEAIKRENRAAAQVSPEDLRSIATSRVGPSAPVAPASKPAGEAAPDQESEAAGMNARRRGKPADYDNAKNDNERSTHSSGCEGTQPTGS